MKGPGILWMLQTAAGLSMAGPMFVIGFSYLRSGQPLGVGFLVLGLVALYLPTYFVNRIGGPRTWIRRRLGRNSDDDESSPQLDDESGTDVDRTHSTDHSSLLERIRRR